VKALLRSPWALLALALAWLAFTGWARPLALPDEGRYTSVAWAMLSGGDWLTPRLNGLPFFHKPPLFYWITAGSMALFGANEWAARAAPLLGASIGTAATFLFARRWLGERPGRLALLAAATQPFIFLGGQYANLDMLVAGCIGATVLAFAHVALLPADAPRPRVALATGYLFAALGVLAKGLIGLALPGLVLVAWLLLRRDWRSIGRLLWVPGIALFFVVAAPWFVLMQQHFPDFLHYFFIVQQFDRYAVGGFNNQQPAWFYPVVLVLLALPWSLWMFAGARSGRLRDPERGSVRLLFWVWLAAILLFFSIPASKPVGYVMPATWPIALLAADAFSMARFRGATHWWRASAGVAAAICLAAVAGVATSDNQSTRVLARTLRAQSCEGDALVYLHGAYYDVAFYAQLRRPAQVVEYWADPAISAHDSWGRELADAGRFDPAAARALLLQPQDLDRLASQRTVWVIGASSMLARYPILKKAQPVAHELDQVLWRLDPPGSTTSRGCTTSPGRPGWSRSD
jgi:4-amino-4-deoxy-L-arabinose transferase-like glycosyltransferase